MDGELMVNRCRLLPLEWIGNEILLCSTENYVQSVMMENDNVRKQNVYMYVYWVTMLQGRKKIVLGK